MYTTINPASGEKLDDYGYDRSEQIERILEGAETASRDWCKSSFDKRASVLNRASDILRQETAVFARLMTREMGKPIEESFSEVEKCAWVCEYFAENAESFLESRPVRTDASESYVKYEPLGPILAIMPWNFPFWQVFRFAAPNLMAGNVGILKHAPNVQGCARKIVDIFKRAGLPDAAFQNLFAREQRIPDIIKDRRVRGVTLTGSLGAGRAVAKEAGEAIKPTVLELGGSDPFVVLEDANVDEAVEGAVTARTLNSGQSCIAAKRFIVEEAIYESFVEKLAEKLSAQRVGPPMESDTDVGPIARDDLRKRLDRQVETSIESGAKCRFGGEVPSEEDGYFYPVTLLEDVQPGMAAFDEETFGPVAAVTSADHADEAVALANKTNYGLGASIWTSRERGRDLIKSFEAGHVAVNGIVKSDPRLPFGGIKESGYGRELSREGMLEFVNKKTVWVK